MQVDEKTLAEVTAKFYETHPAADGAGRVAQWDHLPPVIKSQYRINVKAILEAADAAGYEVRRKNGLILPRA